MPVQLHPLCSPQHSHQFFSSLWSARSHPQPAQAFLCSSMFKLHEAHVIIKLHNNQTCLLNFTFPSVAVHHFLPPSEGMLDTLDIPHNTRVYYCWALTKLVPLHSALSSPPSPLPTLSAPGFSPSHTSTPCTPALHGSIYDILHDSSQNTSPGKAQAAASSVFPLLQRQRKHTATMTAAQTALRDSARGTRGSQASSQTSHQTACYEETPSDFHKTTARCPLLWHHCPSRKKEKAPITVCTESRIMGTRRSQLLPTQHLCE